MTEPKKVGSQWTGEKKQRCAGLWRDGLTATQIADELGKEFNRNMIIGFVHRNRERLGLKERAPRRAGVSKAKRTRPSKACVQRVKQQKPQKPEGSMLTEPHDRFVLKARIKWATGHYPAKEGCKWPIGHVGEPDFHFCELTRRPLSPYCDNHHARAYTGIPVRRR